MLHLPKVSLAVAQHTDVVLHGRQETLLEVLSSVLDCGGILFVKFFFLAVMGRLCFCLVEGID